MPVNIFIQSSIKPDGAETEAAAEDIRIEPNFTGDFSHPLLGLITIEVIKDKEIVDGAMVNFHFGGSLSTDAWVHGDQQGSLYLKALALTTFTALENGGRLPKEFPQNVTLANVFLRAGDPSMELSIMKRSNASGDSWVEVSKVQISFS